MIYTLAFNAFKESMSAETACRIAGEAILRVDSNATVHRVPIADGGDGTMEALVAATNGRVRTVRVSDPLGRTVRASYGFMHDGSSAIIEMAKASGLALLSRDERNPMKTTTRGTGELILDAYQQGARDIIVGIGGSATNDAGLGFAQVFGYSLVDKNGRDVEPTGEGLCELAAIRPPDDLPRMRVRVACDVDNPLYGKKGAAYVYALQKGATDDMLPRLDEGLRNLARIMKRDLGVDVADTPGAGAAGGLGAGLIAFLGAKLERGVDLVLDAAKLDSYVEQSDLVITGEGTVDEQTAYGKAPAGVAESARRYGKPCVLIAGTVQPGAEALHDVGVTALFSLLPGPVTMDEAIRCGEENLSRTAEEIVRLIVR